MLNFIRPTNTYSNLLCIVYLHFSFMEEYKKHYVAVIGGSISGSEAASILAQKGFRVVVFDMKALPYGKIEDGLPNWHINLRNRQQVEIDKKLDQENIRFVPLVKIGRDIPFRDLVYNWGFTAVILANGAWKDRAFPIKNIDTFRNRGLIYQNDFIYWFNHKHEPNYKGPHYQIKDQALVVGGGLASLDVVKIFMIELVSARLKARFNIDVDVFTLEKFGIDKVLSDHNIDFQQLDLKGVTLIYRRTAKDMPLKSPRDNTKESIERAREVSERLLQTYIDKYKFKFKPLRFPVNFIEEDNQFKGLVLQKVQVKDGQIIPLEGAIEKLKSELLVSSIGSIPEQIEGLEYEWSALKMKQEADYHVYGYDHVFAVGNAVTGRGNIQESKQHGQKITHEIIDKHLTADALEAWLTNLNTSIKHKTSNQVHSIIDEISQRDIQPDDIIKSILERTQKLNDAHGYNGYKDWIERHKPIRLEEVLAKSDK